MTENLCKKNQERINQAMIDLEGSIEYQSGYQDGFIDGIREGAKNERDALRERLMQIKDDKTSPFKAFLKLIKELEGQKT